ncbi:MAG: C2H2-type zinc finger protein [Bacteroidota bacterium]
MPNFYCEYCGRKFSTVASLAVQSCPNHPNGMSKGKHRLYQGTEKSQYTCEYCGRTFSSIMSMTVQNCSYHPNGMGKGKHSPAL